MRGKKQENGKIRKGNVTYAVGEPHKEQVSDTLITAQDIPRSIPPLPRVP